MTSKKLSLCEIMVRGKMVKEPIKEENGEIG
jgi:hypothetical protein